MDAAIIVFPNASRRKKHEVNGDEMIGVVVLSRTQRTQQRGICCLHGADSPLLYGDRAGRGGIVFGEVVCCI